jgi:selenocysteine lyase/cysteine desulfurase
LSITQKIAPQTDWRAEFFELDDVVYLNAAGQGPLPRVAIRAAQAALEWKKLPHRLPDDSYFGLPDRIRERIGRLIGGEPDEVAVTTGATTGLAAVAHGLDWKPGDEVLIGRGEFPAHVCTWAPLAEQGKLTLKVVNPRQRLLTAEDFLREMGPRTRVVSASLVRFDDGSRLDVRQGSGGLAEACCSAGALLLLDVSQCAGALPLDLRSLGADFAVCAGYKWLLSPYGTGFFWAQRERIKQLRTGPFYWMALEGARDFHSLSVFGDAAGDSQELAPLRLAAGARRWDAPETASFFNLAAMEASLDLLLRIGVESIWAHINRLVEQIVERLPRDRCVLVTPQASEQRGPYVCVAGRTAEKTRALFEKLRAANIVVSLRENALRIAPHLYNTERDVDRLIAVLAA